MSHLWNKHALRWYLLLLGVLLFFVFVSRHFSPRREWERWEPWFGTPEAVLSYMDTGTSEHFRIKTSREQIAAWREQFQLSPSGSSQRAIILQQPRGVDSGDYEIYLDDQGDSHYLIISRLHSKKLLATTPLTVVASRERSTLQLAWVMYPMAVTAFVFLFPLISVLWVRWGRAPEQKPTLRSCVLCILVSNISWVLTLLLLELRDYHFDHPARVLVSGCLYYTVMSLIITPFVYGLMSLWGRPRARG